MTESIIRKVKDFCRKVLRRIGIRLPKNITYPLSGIVVKTKHNEFFWNKLESGKWEKNCIKFFKNQVKRGDIILDVGAWIGPYTLLFSKLVRDNGKVIAFEPDLKSFRILKENIYLNKTKNITIEKLGISDISGITKFYFFGGKGSSGSSLIKHKYQSNSKSEAIRTITIDKYCSDNKIHPTGIKIDVESAENLVLDGAKEIIA